MSTPSLCVQSFRNACDSLLVPGITERWNAVQQHLHPHLAELAHQIHIQAIQRYPRHWPLYEVSFKSQRYINRGRGERSPIDEYHVACDRPPRGCGILISVSGAEQALLVGIQLWRIRKQALRHLWSTGAPIWQPLIDRLAQDGQIRFRGWKAETTESSKTDNAMPITPPTHQATWIDTYLATRTASYLWAGFVYPWATLPTTFDEIIVAHVLELFPLNEALMEIAEMPEPYPRQTREHRGIFSFQTSIPDIETISEHIQSQAFIISETIVRSYHISLQTRPLVILSGISGTGKTRLTRLYADAIHKIPTPAHDNPYYLLVAVQPDWHNARDLLGYYNAITGLYHPTPFLRFLLQATADPQQTYFVCLDEMNLARPEYYLAPFLSALETTEHTIDLGIPSNEATAVTGETLRNPFRLPLNISITGTVNVDESTYALSDKVLDRANVIELTDVDLAAFRTTYHGTIDENLWQVLCQIYTVVADAGHPFGYRTLREMLHYIEHAQGTLSLYQALDLQVKQKILPKLRGEDSPPLRRALNTMETLLQASQLSESAEKVHRMLERLNNDGFTDFYA